MLYNLCIIIANTYFANVQGKLVGNQIIEIKTMKGLSNSLNSTLFSKVESTESIWRAKEKLNGILEFFLRFLTRRKPVSV